MANATILVVDDEELIRWSLREGLKEEGYEILESGTGHEALAHAEVEAIRAAAAASGDWHLTDVTLYITLEPCVMCAGAILAARIPRVVFGAWDEKAGACGSLFDIPRDPRLNHRPQVRGGVLRDPCALLLREFFTAQRQKP